MRKRFNASERAILVTGAVIEWRNVTQWHPARVTGEITKDSLGYEYVPLVNLATTRTVHSGQYITGCPGFIREANRS